MSYIDLLHTIHLLTSEIISASLSHDAQRFLRWAYQTLGNRQFGGFSTCHLAVLYSSILHEAATISTTNFRLNPSLPLAFKDPTWGWDASTATDAFGIKETGAQKDFIRSGTVQPCLIHP